MNQKPIILLFSICLILTSPFVIQGQSVLQQADCHDIHYGFPSYKWLNKDLEGNYFLGIEKTHTDSEGLYIDDTFIPAFRHFPDDFSLALVDFFICKLDPEFRLSNALVIDNAELDRDLFCGEQYTLYTMSLIDSAEDKDSFPILINGIHEISREGNKGKGVVVVMDNLLQYQEYFIPSTGDIGQIAVDGHMAYIELRIPDNEPFIVVNGIDTIHNHHHFEDPNDFGRQTVLICKFDLLSHQAVWTLRIGDVGYEELIEMLIDGDHNLVILGETSSTYFSFNDVDTVANQSDHNPFIAKYTPDGEFLGGFINANQENAYARNMIVDSERNIFVAGFYYGDDYFIGDTILLRPGTDFPNNSQSTITKFDPNGNFAWIMQADGNFERTGFYDVAELNHEQIVVCGDFKGGQIEMNENTYFDIPGEDQQFGYLMSVSKITGIIEQHVMTEGNYRREFYDVEVDSEGHLDLFMRFRGIDTIFGNIYESPLSVRNGYLIKLDLSSVSNVELFKYEPMFNIVPNPVTSEGFTLFLPDSIKAEDLNYFIFNSIGSMILKGRISSEDDLFISTSNLISGTYFIELQTSNQTQTQIFNVK